MNLLQNTEPELVREAEWYQLEIVGFTSTHSLGSGREGGLSSILGLPALRGGELVWACL